MFHCPALSLEMQAPIAAAGATESEFEWLQSVTGDESRDLHYYINKSAIGIVTDC